MASMKWTTGMVRSYSATSRNLVKLYDISSVAKFKRNQACAAYFSTHKQQLFWNGQRNNIQSALPQRDFSDMPLKRNTDELDQTKSINKTTPRYALDVLPQPFTPGQALFVLQKKGADGSLLSISDVTRLCQASRSGHFKDALVIQNALIQFQKCWKFTMRDPDLTTIICDGMLRAVLKEDYGGQPVEKLEKSTPGELDLEKDFFADSKIKAGLFLAQAFVKRETGFYYSMKLADVEKFLSILLEGLVEYHQSHSGVDKEENDDGDEEKTINYLKKEEPARLAAMYLINPNPEVPRRITRRKARYVLKRIFGNMCLPKFKPSNNDFDPKDILEITKEVYYTLLIRSSRPDKNMKKRAKRSYLKKLILLDGPNEQITELVTNICGYVGGSSEAKEIVDMWEKKLIRDNWDGSKEIDISKLRACVEEWENKEKGWDQGDEEADSLNDLEDDESQTDDDIEDDAQVENDKN